MLPRKQAHLKQGGPERHQRRLVYVVLTLMTGYFAMIGSLNVFLFHAYPTAALDYIGGIGSGLFLRYFHQSQNLRIASMGVVAILIAVMLVFVHIADGRAYSLIWITLVPPITFFLLGRRMGACVTGGVFLYIIAFVYLRLPQWQPIEVGLGTLLNIIEVFIAHLLLFQLYERSRSEAFAELEHLSETDKLTGLVNRSRLDVILSDELLQHERSGRPLALILSDVDHFKRINDEHGHLIGDDILKGIADFLFAQCRQSDTCGRWGGEEFLIICPDTAVEEAIMLVERIQQACHAQKFINDIQVSLSFGVAVHTAGTDADQLLQRADYALYEAKRQGRDRYVIAQDTSSD
ncbi:GGDEF domain-containing protein [Pseudohongiella nitratireducens]|uniref:GGDEF domain-containing protein n=1 Tax=Pseudohongiella nitratireducens TaxID=1768907 RepID=UPI0030EC6A6C